ncbi:hypothetical protein BJ085DRAFT_35002 [Dimargaris cristalligena]|uniref:Uncharacterized protein n=1 Tax=Dimargaris cristalligena TaxID=215637 RepID=A0A4P9ZIW9_9FUNG|nr:hypothetical protein BJ085DRAFT_35002 [Dimargaris cristalligena]|eukprot:RKP33137.1 hypothetical protein BJ085DRAFT_35002 [Dimargaris cristalligena]
MVNPATYDTWSLIAVALVGLNLILERIASAPVIPRGVQGPAEFKDFLDLKAYFQTMSVAQFQQHATIVDSMFDRYLLSNSRRKGMMLVYLSEKQKRGVSFCERDIMALPILSEWLAQVQSLLNRQPSAHTT